MTEVLPQTEIDARVLDHARMVMEAMLVDGEVVPLLGAGVNLCGRVVDEPWQAGQCQ